jgi:hypothetical protein
MRPLLSSLPAFVQTDIAFATLHAIMPKTSNSDKTLAKKPFLDLPSTHHRLVLRLDERVAVCRFGSESGPSITIATHPDEREENSLRFN